MNRVSPTRRLTWGLLLLILAGLPGEGRSEVRISESSDEGMACFVIETPSATYFYQKEAGGFSSILDRDGNDWVAWNRSEAEAYPASAASDYRGLPNLVFQSDDGGSGHPGFSKCDSIQVDARTLRSTSKSGKWQWTWRFTETHATLTVDRADPEHAYWFLYEGPIAGRFAPGEQYWGTDQGGPHFQFPDYFQTGGAVASWNWAYFGDKAVSRVLLLEHLTPDTLPDLFGYLGNTDAGLDSPDGMVVFGFGRELNARALMVQTPHVFRLSFREQPVLTGADHIALSRTLARWALDFEESVPGPYTRNALEADCPGLRWAELRGRASLVDSPDPLRRRALRIVYPKGGVGPGEGGAQFLLDLPPREAYWLSYDFLFEDGFDFRLGGKLPGLTSGGDRYTGGVLPKQGQGWSARFMWRQGGKLVLYLYWIDMPGKWGQDFPFSMPAAEPGRWYSVTQFVQVNTPGKRDGIIRVWVDGEPVLDLTGLRLRQAPNGLADSFYFSTFHGGNTSDWGPHRDSFTRFDNFQVWED